MTTAPEAEGSFGEQFIEEFDRLLRWRRDVRRFRTDPVEPRLIQEIVAAAELAPSVGNSQPWRWVEVRSPELRAVVKSTFARCNAEALEGYRGERAQQYASLKLAGLDQAPVHLAVFSEDHPQQGHGLGRRTMPETLAYSVVTAISSLWLAARARGIGVGWISIVEPDEVHRALGVPPGWRFVAYLCIGYPEEVNSVPELERAGWQARTDPETRYFIR
ncbi:MULTISPECIES: 5,6-dimethylbenzimidazole synthase [Gordonia]|uniref:5,6-dimethylbenzimidazole synthase n=2 Tax=Gordonia TaxID=2053 RepID=A0ABP5UM97_9ACTN|nr:MULTISPECIES: 5,6-dimethylbenzimidazole synthase [Gordonia]AUH68956.1 5,6-dimethylbenzimidazole synthase [Gordonia sp. YC-JH1]KXT56419.1 cob(II)yrinic acid a,c-diamide reductase [Gordonia sp. QH-12]MBY4570737.1 5,6-dimethylbenzimidazole synthase [Gordonia sihwensis]WFN94826.1 5,6-dimethylbenzimidazole synthase [Gordonia sihwensis]GAC59758.1 putative oxidoreductase [Gordonia sihwensis NBRC 108236]